MDIDTILDKFQNDLALKDSFIADIYNYIYDEIPDITSEIMVECLRIITWHNKQIIESRKEQLYQQSETMKKAKAIIEPSPVEETESPCPKEVILPERKDVSTYVDLLSFSSLDEETEKKVSGLSHEAIKRIKLIFLQKKLTLEKKIKTVIMGNPSFAIAPMQQELQKIKEVFLFLEQLEAKEETHSEEIAYSNIILLPNGRTSYFFEDIQNYVSSKKEIKNTFDKIIDGYFLKTRDTKPIEGINGVNLYEYRHPNGIRILYVAENNYIFICSLFYKDKQKSIKIENYYAEAVRRYQSSIASILVNLNNPDFFIEQDEFIGQINTLLETGNSLVKKEGDK